MKVNKMNKAKYWIAGSGFNKQLHRIDGPAVEAVDGNDAWYLYGKWVARPRARYFQGGLYKDLMGLTHLNYKGMLMLTAYIKAKFQYEQATVE
jgi:hypothetical protein